MAAQALGALSLEDNPGNYQNFCEYLQKREFYDIKTSAVVPISGDHVSTSSTGQSPAVSNQGSDPTCSSHSMGKCIVGIVDQFGLGVIAKYILKGGEQSVRTPAESAVKLPPMDKIT